MIDNIESAEPISNIMFAIAIDGHDAATMNKYFMMTVNEVSLSRPAGSNVPKTRT